MYGDNEDRFQNRVITAVDDSLYHVTCKMSAKALRTAFLMLLSILLTAAEFSELIMDFGPTDQTISLEATENVLEPITCTVNKPVNISISMKKSCEKRIIGKIKLPRGVSLRKESPMGVRVDFDNRLKGECQNGTYVCTAIDAFGNTFSKEAKVHLVDDSAKDDPKFHFGLENADVWNSEKEVEIIAGETIGFICTFRSEEFKSFLYPFIGFYKLNKEGKLEIINESLHHPKKFEWSVTKIVDSKEHPNSKQGRRILYIRNATMSDSNTYACAITLTKRGCVLHKYLELNVL